MDTLEERIKIAEDEIAFLKALHTEGSSDRMDDLNIKLAQHDRDLIYSAEETVEIYRTLINQVGSLRESLSKHINLHSKKKGTNTSYLYSSIKEGVSDEKLHSD